MENGSENGKSNGGHNIVNMHNQCTKDECNLTASPSCLPAFYALAIPVSCYISNVFSYFFFL